MALYDVTNRMIGLRSGALAGTPANLRIEHRVKIDNLARQLLEMRKWLTEHGCSSQIFHCVRAGSEAVIAVEFELDAAALLSHFHQEFGGSELTR